MSITITNTTKSKSPDLPFLEMKEAVLGKRYDLSLVFVGDVRSRRLNRVYRGRDKATNILSFPVAEGEGEIFINQRVANAQASRFGRGKKNFIAFLFIHGLVHLKGYDHGGTMEREEVKIRKRFGV